MEDNNPLDKDVNEGIVKRHAYFKGARTVELMGRIHADMFYQQKYLPNDVTIRIRLVRNKNEFCLMTTEANMHYKLRLKECKIFVRKVRLSPSVFVAHAKALEAGNAKYPVRRVICKTFTVPRGNLDCSQENLFFGQLPTRLVIGCVENEAFNGHYERNQYNFKHLI